MYEFDEHLLCVPIANSTMNMGSLLAFSLGRCFTHILTGAIVGKDRRAKISRQYPGQIRDSRISGHRRSSSLIPRLDILKSVYLPVFRMLNRVYSIAR
eukprot:g74037.t1